MPEPMSAAFISYCRQDSDFALRLAKDLKDAGAAVWLDQIDIKPGHPWDNAVEDALLAAHQMLVVLTPVSVKSENVRDEISYALKQGKTVIPVLYMECVIPLRLERKQHIDFRTDYARGLATLLSQLHVEHPNRAVLEKAAEGDAQRQLAWQAREAEVAHRKREERAAIEEAVRLEQETEARRLKDLEKKAEAERLVREAETERLRQREERAAQEVSVRKINEEMARRELVESKPIAQQEATPSEATSVIDSGDTKAERWPMQKLFRIAFGAMICLVLIGVAWFRMSRSSDQGTVLPPSSISSGGPKAESAQTTQAGTVSEHNTTAADQPAQIAVPVQAVGAKSAPSPVSSSRLSPAATTSSDPATLARQGQALNNSKRYAEALPLLLAACEGGSGAGCNEVSFFYSHSLITKEEDRIRAVAVFLEACDREGPAECQALGSIVGRSDGSGVNYGAARTLDTKACDGGIGYACEALSDLYRLGQGVPVNMDLARQLLQKACNIEGSGPCERLKELK